MSNTTGDKLILNVQNLQATSCTEGVICDLGTIDISDQSNPCVTVSVPVRVGEGVDCREGAAQLDQLAMAIGQCLGIGTVDTDVSSFTGRATSEDTAILVVSEDGVDREVFVEGENLTFSGEGTPTNPLTISAIGVPTDVEDGVGINVTGQGTPDSPFVVSVSVCDVPVANQGAVDAASSVLVLACVDNQTRLVPLPETPDITDQLPAQICELPVMTQAEVDAASARFIAACIDNEETLIPLPTFQIPEIPEIDEYTCVPVVLGEPSGPPDDGTGPIRIDCDGSIWLYPCGGGDWQHLTFGVPDLEQLDPADVANICDELKFNSWYDDDNGCSETQREVSLEQLSSLIQICICASLNTLTNSRATHSIDCINGEFTRVPLPEKNIVSTNGTVSITETTNAAGDTTCNLSVNSKDIVSTDGSVTITETTSNGQTTCDLSVDDAEVAAAAIGTGAVGGSVCVGIDPVTGGLRNTMIYQARDNTIINGTANIGVVGGPGIITISDTNPFNGPAIARIHVRGNTRHRALGAISEANYDALDMTQVFELGDTANVPIPPYFDIGLDTAVVALSKGSNSNSGTAGNPAGAGSNDLFERVSSSPMIEKDILVPQGGSINQFAQWWLVIDLDDLSGAIIPELFFHGEMTASILWLRA